MLLAAVWKMHAVAAAEEVGGYTVKGAGWRAGEVWLIPEMPEMCEMCEVWEWAGEAGMAGEGGNGRNGGNVWELHINDNDVHVI